MQTLNFRHLHAFYQVARVGNLTRAAGMLNVSQSALSTQIKALEDRLDTPLFLRTGRTLELTETGRIALDHAERIFATGQELVATLALDPTEVPPLRIGAEATLSRNFQLQFLRPLLDSDQPRVVVRSGSRTEMLEELAALALDVVLTTEPPKPAETSGLLAHHVANERMALHGAPHRLHHKTLADLLTIEPVVLSNAPLVRSQFDSLCARLGVTPHLVAEVDDMAMIRLFARADVGVALAPPIVFADEIASGRLAAAPFDLNISETFFAVVAQRSYPHPGLQALLADHM